MNDCLQQNPAYRSTLSLHLDQKNPALFHIIIHPSTRFFADFIYTLSSQAKITKIKNPAYWSLPHVFLAE
jgi:hypothetical protein